MTPSWFVLFRREVSSRRRFRKNWQAFINVSFLRTYLWLWLSGELLTVMSEKCVVLRGRRLVTEQRFGVDGGLARVE